MGTICDVEWREVALSPKDRAVARDSFVREFERRFSDWSEIARVCSEIERDKDWEVLGYKSYHQWLIAAAPRSRSYIYLVTGRYKELKDDFTDEELSQIDLDSTKTLRKLSPAVRHDPEVREAAKKKPRELRRLIVERHPEQHVEDIEERTLKFETSQAAIFDEAVEAWRKLNNPEESAEAILEDILNDYLDSPCNEDSPYSRRQVAQQRESVSA